MSSFRPGLVSESISDCAPMIYLLELSIAASHEPPPTSRMACLLYVNVYVALVTYNHAVPAQVQKIRDTHSSYVAFAVSTHAFYQKATVEDDRLPNHHLSVPLAHNAIQLLLHHPSRARMVESRSITILTQQCTDKKEPLPSIPSSSHGGW